MENKRQFLIVTVRQNEIREPILIPVDSIYNVKNFGDDVVIVWDESGKKDHWKQPILISTQVEESFKVVCHRLGVPSTIVDTVERYNHSLNKWEATEREKHNVP